MLWGIVIQVKVNTLTQREDNLYIQQGATMQYRFTPLEGAVTLNINRHYIFEELLLYDAQYLNIIMMMV